MNKVIDIFGRVISYLKELLFFSFGYFFGKKQQRLEAENKALKENSKKVVVLYDTLQKIEESRLQRYADYTRLRDLGTSMPQGKGISERKSDDRKKDD